MGKHSDESNPIIRNGNRPRGLKVGVFFRKACDAESDRSRDISEETDNLKPGPVDELVAQTRTG
jgi:hypothetical protein